MFTGVVSMVTAINRSLPSISEVSFAVDFRIAFTLLFTALAADAVSNSFKPKRSAAWRLRSSAPSGTARPITSPAGSALCGRGSLRACHMAAAPATLGYARHLGQQSANPLVAGQCYRAHVCSRPSNTSRRISILSLQVFKAMACS